MSCISVGICFDSLFSVQMLVGYATMAADSSSSRLSWRAGWWWRIRRRATELVHQLLDEILGKGFVFVRPRQFCSLSRAQGFVRVTAMSLILHFTMDAADGIVEARATEDL